MVIFPSKPINKSLKEFIAKSGYKTVIYFFNDSSQTTTRKQDFYSKFIGQKEPVNGFDYWRNRIYWYIENSEFGIKWAGIYANQNTHREKEPILTVLGNGLEFANPPSSIIRDQKHN